MLSDLPLSDVTPTGVVSLVESGSMLRDWGYHMELENIVQ